MGREWVKVHYVDGVNCVMQGLSVSKDKSHEHRGISIVCEKNGSIKKIVKAIEKKTDEDYKYEGVTYVDFGKDDKYIVCDMYIKQDENGNKKVFMIIGIRGYAYYDKTENIIDLSTECNGDTTRIITNYEEYLPIVENYNTFEFDNINSYKDFGVYAEAVMTAIQRARQYNKQ